jgi:AI-2 transport protein TqsA
MSTLDAEQRIQTICLLVLSMVAGAGAIYWLRPVLIPFVLAVFFSLGLSPLIDVQTRYMRVPRWLAVVATLALGFLILRLLTALVSASLTQLAANAESYQTQLGELSTRAVAILGRFGIVPPATLDPREFMPVSSVRTALVGTTNAILAVLSRGALVMIFMIFLLIGSSRTTEPATGVWAEVESRVKRFIVTKLLTSGATGLLVGTVLFALGIDLAMVFGLLAFLLNFIPSVGSIVATLLPLPVVLMNPEATGTTIVLAIALPAVIQMVIGNGIEPYFMGSSLDLHPIAILMAMILWGTLWGIVGMLLATPITAVIKILFEKMELTAPVAELLAGRTDALRSL